jgi:hypothetical protein
MATGRTKTTFGTDAASSIRAREAQAQRPLRSQLRNEDLRALRGKQIVELRLANVPIPEIAQRLSISADTVERDLQWMSQTGRIAHLEEQVVDLVPDAVRVVQENLNSSKPDVKAALKVLELLLRLGDRAAERAFKQADREGDLEDYLHKMQIKVAAQKALAADAGPGETPE